MRNLFLTAQPESDAFPSTISVYEKGTSNKKATLGWNKTTGNEYFYLESNGNEKLKLDETGISTTVGIKAATVSASGSIEAYNQGASNLGYDVSTMTSAEIKNTRVENGAAQKTSEIKLNSTGLNYKTTTVSNNVTTVKETKITEEGIFTTGPVTTRSWKVRTPDYVFDPGYKPRSLSEIETFVRENRHLPDVPSAKEMEENGIDIATMNMQILRRVEELTLHVIDLDKELKAQRLLNRELARKVKTLAK